MRLAKKIQDESSLIMAIRQLMERSGGINEAELARQTGIPKTTIYKILSGETADPRGSTLTILAKYFDISLDVLMGIIPIEPETPHTQAKSVPIISWSEALNVKKTISNLNTNTWKNWLTIDAEVSAAYALTSRPCMEPYFPRGTTLIIDSETQPTDGDLIIVIYPETKEAALRELSIDGPNKLLLSLNPNSPPGKLEDFIKIVGTVIQSRFCY